MFSGCGVAGIFRFGAKGQSAADWADICCMTSKLVHRGPNGGGVVSNGPISLGHRRLSILDLSDRGSQPMRCGSLSIVYNGELYNFSELRAELIADGFDFESEGDTEVVLRAFQRWGLDALNKFEGMYAFGIWDDSKQQLTLARDRVGIKPLYYYLCNKFIAFSSEVESLIQHRDIPCEIDVEAFSKQILLSTTLNVDRRQTLIRGVRTLLPGSVAVVSDDGYFSETPYWWPRRHEDAQNCAPNDELEEMLSHELDRGVRRMLVSDVPVSVFLSGGLDSVAITSIAAAAPGGVAAITAQYGGAFQSEDARQDVEYATRFAGHLGDTVVHSLCTVEPVVAIDQLDEVCDLAALCDDFRHLAISQNYRAVSDLNCAVVLNGQGADELMGGYVFSKSFKENVFDVQSDVQGLITRMPLARRSIREQFIDKETLRCWKQYDEEFRSYFKTLPGDDLNKSHRLLFELQIPRILQFEDYLSMRHGVECRVPFLSTGFIELCQSVPVQRHLDTERMLGKAVLRNVLRRRLPQWIVDRPKVAFPFPSLNAMSDALRTLVMCHLEELRNSELLSVLLTPGTLDCVGELLAKELWLILIIWRWEVRFTQVASRKAHIHPISEHGRTECSRSARGI